MLPLHANYYRDISWLFSKLCCHTALEDTEEISASVAPVSQICAFAISLLYRGKL